MVTGLVTDSGFDTHTMQGHPEFAGRLQAVRQELASDGLVDLVVQLEAVAASEEAIRRIHTQRYLERLQQTTRLSGTVMMGVDTYVTPQSYAVAQLAAGGVCQAVGAVLDGTVDNALALIRPPGHHATPSAGMGFCLINNVAVAARYAQYEHGIERVLIVDYDVHHGNGTQEAFYADPSVLYVSTHQFPLYPGTGLLHETGQAEGEGYTLNIPLPSGVGDEGYTQVFEEIVLPAAHRFEPELVLVSAGLDAHWADPLAQMRLTLTGYDALTRKLVLFADEGCSGHIVFVMEGGYDLQVLGHGWANITRALLHDSAVDDPIGGTHRGETSIDSLIHRIQQIHNLTSYTI